LERALALSGDEVSAARGKALEEAGWLAHDRGDPDRTEALQVAALAIWRALGDRRGEARSLDELGNVAHDRGDFARATALHEEALAILREVGDRRGVGRALNNLAMVALYQSDDERAWPLYNEALAALREVGDAYGVNVVPPTSGSSPYGAATWTKPRRCPTSASRGAARSGTSRGSAVPSSTSPRSRSCGGTSRAPRTSTKRLCS
jgi:tetratricopeptide (TPR) repeat protein